jgi:gliding motility-associated-like protein
MKTNIYLIATMALIAHSAVLGQNNESRLPDYNENYWLGYTKKLGLTPSEQAEFLTAKKKEALSPSSNQSANHKYAPPSSNQLFSGGCNNIDFETGNLQGWTATSGFHPLWNNLGCCPNPGGQQTIMGNTNAAVVDPFGGFPVVAPGGSFSLRLGNSATGGQADRVEQTFMVSAANANFSYRYAVVFQDPGHVAAQQPAFVIEMFDSTNSAIPCTYYNVSSGQNIPGFFNAPNGVVYKPWTTVVVDLTNYIGQNVTIRFSTYDCALGGHFGYAYIDGNCAAFQTTMADTLCVGQSKILCAPPGFGSYTWVGGSVNGQTTQCVSVSNPGNYQVQTTMVTNCQGPTFNYPVFNHPTPNANFNIGNSTNSSCNFAITFQNTSSMSSGSLTTYIWNFGDNTTSTLHSPTHTYSAPGTYTVSLIVGSAKGCFDTTRKVITIDPTPLTSIGAPVICENASVVFTDNTQINPGSIVQWYWDFGNGQTSAQQNPSATFTSSGVHQVSLTVTTNKGCIGTGVHTVMVNPLPLPNFINDVVCLGTATSFSNASTISAGSIANYIWNFGNNATSTTTNGTFTFGNYGYFPVQLTAISAFNCAASITKTVQVYANPTADFSIPNACAGNLVQVNANTSNVPEGFINAYNWDFGNNQTLSGYQPVFVFQQAGVYNITLTVTANTICKTTAVKSITIHSNPVVAFSGNTACLNQNTQFTNSSLIQNGFISKWLWDFQNDGIKDDTASASATYVYPYAGTFVCHLTAVSNNQCVGSNTLLVTVRPNPYAEFRANSVCLGDKTYFTNLSGSPQSAITSYQWQYYGDGNVSNVYPNAAHTYSASGVYLVKLEVQNEFGCTNVQSKAVYVNPKPVAQFAANNYKGCDNICVTFTNQSYISSGKIVTYQWQFGDGSMPNYSEHPTYCFKNGKHSITLKVVSDSGCISTYVNHNMIEVYPKPLASFITEPEELDEMEPIISVSSSAMDANETAYYINDGGIYLKENFSHTFTNLDKQKPIIFQVVTSAHGCKDTASKIINLKKNYAIYIPNTFTPNYDGTNDGFKAVGYNINKFHLRIFDRWGHLVFETNDMNEAWDGHTKNSSEAIKDDVYVWKANVVDVHNKSHELVGHVTLLK